MIWQGSLKEDDPEQQIRIVEQFVSEGVGGIVLAPIDDTALMRPVAAAMQKGISVVIMDSALKGDPPKDFVCTVSTNNHRAGEMAGEQLGRLLDGKGKVVLFRHKEGSASTDQREAGFLEAIKKFSGIQVILDNRYSGTTISEDTIDRVERAGTRSKRRTESSVRTNRALWACYVRSSRITWRAARSSSASTRRRDSWKA